MGNVKKMDLVKTVSERTGLLQVDSRIVIECFFKTVSDCLISGRNIELRGFGRFKVKNRKARIARNIWTGEKIVVPKCKKPVLEFSKYFKWDIDRAIQKQNQTERVL